MKNYYFWIVTVIFSQTQVVRLCGIEFLSYETPYLINKQCILPIYTVALPDEVDSDGGFNP